MWAKNDLAEFGLRNVRNGRDFTNLLAELVYHDCGWAAVA